MIAVHGDGPLCIAKRGSRSTLKAGRRTRVPPDPGYPARGSFCSKSRAAPELAHREGGSIERDVASSLFFIPGVNFA
jgi:hypothetical protein